MSVRNLMGLPFDKSDLKVRSHMSEVTSQKSQVPISTDYSVFTRIILYGVAVIVQKYGGSSVADVQKLQSVADRVTRTRQLGHQVVVVVSAMGDTTDELLALAKQVSPSPSRRELDMLLSAGAGTAMALLSMAIRERGGDAISFTGSQSGIITTDR